jgi:catalase
MDQPTPGKAKPATARTSGQRSSEIDDRSEGRENPKTDQLAAVTAEPGQKLTGNQGVGISDDQNTLRAGIRGPSLLEDFYFREKITHFDQERIPERVVHARGAGAHGVFECYEDLDDLTCASLFKKGKQTPAFVRFSTVAGSRGSLDTPRDVRGFAVKFFTDEGVWDLVGNNMPVFFIQDAIKFPDLVHAVKPEPNDEIPQAATAHDTFWDFASLTPEIAHMLMWAMSDRAIPRSFAMMEGFGVHTFRFVNAKGQSHLVKFHWKPLKGVHSLVWDEAQLAGGKDPDFNRRDLFESIERGDYPQWEFGIQLVDEDDQLKFGYDLLDPTKIIPEEDVPVRRIGKLTLNRNPDNFFAETEQVAFHPGHVVPGVDFTNDPLLQGRLFSYLDTQLKRVGPNFAELPINRPLVPVRNNERDAQARIQINKGRVSYFPNSLDGGCPMHSPEAVQAFRSYTERIDGQKVRARSDSFSDHFSQARLFWNSMAEWEKRHIANAYGFELNQCTSEDVRTRMLNEVIVNIHEDLARRVSELIGIPVNPVGTPDRPTPSAPTPSGPVRKHDKKSPALSMDKPSQDIKGRHVAVLAGEGVDGDQLADIKEALQGAEAVVEVVAARAGTFTCSKGSTVKVNRAAPNASSIIYDAVVVPGGKSADALANSSLAINFMQECFHHGKPVAAIGDGEKLLQAAHLPQAGPDMGVFRGDASVMNEFMEAMKKHRFHDREIAAVPA